MYLNAFMQPPEGLELSACWRREALVQESWLMRLAFAVYLAGTDNQDAGYRLYCRGSTVAGGTGTQLARHFLTRGYTSFRSIPSTRMTSVPYKRCAGTGLLLLGKHVLSAYARGSTWLRDAQQLRRCLAKTPQVSTPPPADSCSTPLWICCCWLGR